MSLNFNWCKSYDKKHKNAKNTKYAKSAKSVFVQNHKKREMETFAFCDITFEPITIKTC